MFGGKTDLERARAVLATMAAAQDALRAEADRLELFGFEERMEWLIANRNDFIVRPKRRFIPSARQLEIARSCAPGTPRPSTERHVA